MATLPGEASTALKPYQPAPIEPVEQGNLEPVQGGELIPEPQEQAQAPAIGDWATSIQQGEPEAPQPEEKDNLEETLFSLTPGLREWKEQQTRDTIQDEEELGEDFPEELKRTQASAANVDRDLEAKGKTEVAELEAASAGKNRATYLWDKYEEEKARGFVAERNADLEAYAKYIKESFIVQAGDDASQYSMGARIGFGGTGSMALYGLAQIARNQGNVELANSFQEQADAIERTIKEGGNTPNVTDIFEVRSSHLIQDLGDYLAFQAGQAVGNIAPIMAVTAASTPAGGLGFTYVLSLGEVRKGLLEAGIKDETKIAQYAYPVAGAVAAFDMALPASIWSKTIGKSTRQKVVRGFIRAFVRGTARGSATEGVTEMMQESLQIAAIAHAKDGDGIFDMEPVWDAFAKDGKWKEAINAGIGGALGGAQISGAMSPLEEASARAERSRRIKERLGEAPSENAPVAETAKAASEEVQAEKEEAAEGGKPAPEPVDPDISPEAQAEMDRFNAVKEAAGPLVTRPEEETEEEVTPAAPVQAEEEVLPKTPEQATEGKPTSIREQVRKDVDRMDAERRQWTEFASEAKKLGTLDLDGIEVELPFVDEDGNAGTDKMPASAAINEVEQRMRGVAELVRCLG